MPEYSNQAQSAGIKIVKLRWGLSFLLGFVFIGFEIGEHILKHQAFYADFWYELLVYGGILPLIFGGLLTIINRTLEERTTLANTFDQHVLFSRKMLDTLEWDELASVLVRLPGSLLHLTGSALVTIAPDSDTAQLVKDWWRDDTSFLPLLPSFNVTRCEKCNPYDTSTTLVHISQEACLVHSYVFPNVKTYCVNVVPQTDVTTGVQLYLFCGAKDELNATAVEIFYSYIPPMALAIQRAMQPDVDDIEASATRMERSRIARRLHDSLAQNIGFLRLKLDILQSENGPQTAAEMRQELQQMAEIANQAYDQVRGTLSALQKIPDNVDLPTAILQQARTLGQRSNFEVSLMSSGPEQNLSPKVRHQAIYLIQEALINIQKHANASQVQITLSWQPDALNISVKDNGVGFDAAQIEKNGHYGMEIMRERAAEIDGKLLITSRPNAGTDIQLFIPLENSK